MNSLNLFYKNTLKYDLVNKFFYKNINKLPKLKKIILNFGYKNNNIKNLATSMLALQLITNKKSFFTITKHPNILLKIRKGQPIGCKIILRKQNMILFFNKLITDIIPTIKNFNGFKFKKKTKKNAFSFNFNNVLIFNTLEEQYSLFHTLPKLNITVVLTTNTKQELIFIFNSLKFPIIN